MNHLSSNQVSINNGQQTALVRRSVQASNAGVLADVYQDDVNIAIWKRTLSPDLQLATQQLLSKNFLFRISASVTPKACYTSLCESLGSDNNAHIISEDVAEIVFIYCCLFDLEQVGLRLTTLDRAMCPKFHVDRVPCRLVTTYSGIATQWLPHQSVNREKLGVGSQGKTDEESELYNHYSEIQQLNTGAVALLKGESWQGNEGAGLVHRSPKLADNERRLLLTLDFN